MRCGASYSDLLMFEASPLDGMIRIDSGSSPDCLISSSLAASLSIASLFNLSDIAFNSLHSPFQFSVHAFSRHPGDSMFPQKTEALLFIRVSSVHHNIL